MISPSRTPLLAVSQLSPAYLKDLYWVLVTLRASEAAVQCILIGPVCGFVCLFMGLLPR